MKQTLKHTVHETCVAMVFKTTAERQLFAQFFVVQQLEWWLLVVVVVWIGGDEFRLHVRAASGAVVVVYLIFAVGSIVGERARCGQINGR
jgi:hypothetical protein